MDLLLARDPARPLRGPVPPPLPQGPGPEWVASSYAHGWVALYRRSAEGVPQVLPLHAHPVDQRVQWAGDPVTLAVPDVAHVSWVEEPTLVGEAVVGSLAVHALVPDDDGGLTWGPIVRFRLGRSGDEGVLDARIFGGALREDGFEFTWGDDEAHEIAAMEFLQQHERVLWRLLHGGPGIDVACRVARLSGRSEPYKRWAIDDVVRHGAEAVPELVHLLGSAADVRAGDDGPFLALVVLAHLRAVEAHPVLIRLARLPEESVHELLGDFVTEGLSAALLRTSGGDLAEIRALLLDPAVSVWVRGAAADALSGAVAVGWAPREEVLDLLLGTLERPGVFSEPGSAVYASVARALLDLRAVEHEDRLLGALASGLLNRQDLNEDDVRTGLHEGTRPDCLPQLRSEDVHAWVGTWSD